MFLDQGCVHLVHLLAVLLHEPVELAEELLVHLFDDLEGLGGFESFVEILDGTESSVVDMSKNSGGLALAEYDLLGRLLLPVFGGSSESVLDLPLHVLGHAFGLSIHVLSHALGHPFSMMNGGSSDLGEVLVEESPDSRFGSCSAGLATGSSQDSGDLSVESTEDSLCFLTHELESVDLSSSDDKRSELSHGSCELGSHDPAPSSSGATASFDGSSKLPESSFDDHLDSSASSASESSSHAPADLTSESLGDESGLAEGSLAGSGASISAVPDASLEESLEAKSSSSSPHCSASHGGASSPPCSSASSDGGSSSPCSSASQSSEHPGASGLRSFECIIGTQESSVGDLGSSEYLLGHFIFDGSEEEHLAISAAEVCGNGGILAERPDGSPELSSGELALLEAAGDFLDGENLVLVGVTSLEDLEGGASFFLGEFDFLWSVIFSDIDGSRCS